MDTVESLAKVKASVRFVSCEPLCEKLIFPSMPFEWLIIGGRSKSSQLPAEQPQWSWVESLMWQAREHNIKIYFKPNLEVRPREKPETVPGMTL
jgi:protein gp37